MPKQNTVSKSTLGTVSKSTLGGVPKIQTGSMPTGDGTGFSGPNPLANANVKITPNSRMGKAIAWMAKNCGAKSKHRCASYVASALIAGGFKVNRQQSAYMYHRNGELARLGFKLVGQTTQAGISSISKVGDVIVWDRCPSSPVHGHIAINVGTRVHPKGYCSDFFHGTGVYSRPGAVYVYRHPENANGEVISVSGNGNFAVPQQVANNKPQNIEGKETGDSQAKKPKPQPMPKQNTVSKSTLGGVPKIQTGSKSTGDLKGLDAKTSLKNALAKSQSGENEVHITKSTNTGDISDLTGVVTDLSVLTNGHLNQDGTSTTSASQPEDNVAKLQASIRNILKHFGERSDSTMVETTLNKTKEARRKYKKQMDNHSVLDTALKTAKVELDKVNVSEMKNVSEQATKKSVEHSKNINSVAEDILKENKKQTKLLTDILDELRKGKKEISAKDSKSTARDKVNYSNEFRTNPNLSESPVNMRKGNQ